MWLAQGLWLAQVIFRFYCETFLGLDINSWTEKSFSMLVVPCVLLFHVDISVRTRFHVNCHKD